MKAIKNTCDLREALIDTISRIRDGKMEPQQGNAIANLAGKILQSAKLDLEVAKVNNALALEDGGTKLIGQEPKRLARRATAAAAA